MRPPLPFFFTTSWVIYVRRVVGYFSSYPFALYGEERRCKPAGSFYFSIFPPPPPPGLKHFIILHSADLPSPNCVKRACVQPRLGFLFQFIVKFARSANCRRHAFIRDDYDINPNRSYVRGDATGSHSAVDTLVRVMRKALMPTSVVSFRCLQIGAAFVLVPVYRLITDLEKAAYARSLISRSPLCTAFPHRFRQS